MTFVIGAKTSRNIFLRNYKMNAIEFEQIEYLQADCEDQEDLFGINEHNSSENGQNVQKKAKTPTVPKNVTKNEKRILAGLVKNEPIIWDLLHEHHSNIHALTAAWDRVQKALPNRSVTECKAIWKTLRDGLRYRRKRKLGHTGDSGDEGCANDVPAYWEFDDCMRFLVPTSSKYPRRTTVLGLQETRGDSAVSNDDIANNENINNDVSVDLVPPGFPNAESESNYSYASFTKKKKDPLAESVMNVSKCITEFVKNRCEAPQDLVKPLTFQHIWMNLDKMFEKMSAADVDNLNLQYMQLAINVLHKS